MLRHGDVDTQKYGETEIWGCEMQRSRDVGDEGMWRCKDTKVWDAEIQGCGDAEM